MANGFDSVMCVCLPCYLHKTEFNNRAALLYSKPSGSGFSGSFWLLWSPNFRCNICRTCGSKLSKPTDGCNNAALQGGHNSVVRSNSVGNSRALCPRVMRSAWRLNSSANSPCSIDRHRPQQSNMHCMPLRSPKDNTSFCARIVTSQATSPNT